MQFDILAATGTTAMAQLLELFVPHSLALLAVLALPARIAACASERDCTLSGECVGGRCVCDKPWTGDRCSQLKLKPASLAAPFVWKRPGWPG